MTEIPLRLTLAERQGLAVYSRSLSGYPTAERAKMKEVHDLRRSLPDEVIHASIGGKPAFRVSLERIAADVWEGNCTCPVGTNCIHCAVVADLALGGSPGVPTSAAAEARSLRPPPVASIVGKLLGRGLIVPENAYLQRVEFQFLRAQSLRYATLQDLVAIVASATKSLSSFGHQTLDAWPTFPTDALQYWHGLARVARQRGLPLPDFMERVAEASPPPKAWITAWEKEEIDDWIKRLEVADRSLELARPAAEKKRDSIEFRLVLGRKAPRIEVRVEGASEWAAKSKRQLDDLAEETSEGKIQVMPESQNFWEPLRRAIANAYEFDLSYERSRPVAAVLPVLFQREPLRERILNEALQPFEYPPDPLRWSVTAPTPENPNYRLELVQSDGHPVRDVFTRVDGPPAFAITATQVFRVPAIPHVFSPDRPTEIPAKAIETETGLRLLSHMGAPIPAELQALTENIPLHLHLQFEVQPPDNAYKPVERIRVAISTRSPQGVTIDTYSEAGWKLARSAPKKRRMITFYTRDLVFDPDDLLEPIGAKWDYTASRFGLRITRSFPESFATWVRTLDPSIELSLPELLQSILADPVQAEVTLTATSTDVDWFDLSVGITAQNTDLTQDELNLLLNAKGGYVRLGDKGWRRAVINLSPEDTEQLAHIGLNPTDLSKEPQRLHALQLADNAAAKLLPEAQFELIQNRASEIKARVTPPVPAEIQASLRPYQVDGFHFLAYLAENRFGGVLADDMGLGKTLQTLAWIAWLRNNALAQTSVEKGGAPAPSRILIVCPKSVAPNWRSEASRFLPGLRVTVWQGQAAADFQEILGTTDALVLNFAQLRGLQDHIASQHWLALIIDEAQAIKNPDSQTAQSARAIKASHRLALTGTPIENRLLDLWSILSFAMPGALGPRAAFQRSFGKTADSLARRRLSARVRPFLLRRTKSQVAQDLPARIEEDLICELEGVQRDLYRAEYKKARALLLKVKTSADLDQMRFHFLTSLLRLRQICCHPALVDKRQLKQPSAKVEALLDLLEPLIEEGNKVLIFSQFVTMLDLLQEELRSRNWKDFYLAGDTEDRGPLVDSFNAYDGAAVFLISLKAGGFGLNLTSASYVVLFDPWWNPAVESQAIDRTHRIGQKNTVIAYRLIIKGSIEEKIRELQKQKSALAGDILGEERFSQALTVDDLQYLFNTSEPTV